MEVGRHSAEAVAESLYTYSLKGRGRNKDWACFVWAFEASKPTPSPVTHFLQQSHTYSNKTTPLNSSTTHCQTLKHIN